MKEGSKGNIRSAASTGNLGKIQQYSINNSYDERWYENSNYRKMGRGQGGTGGSPFIIYYIRNI
jgi:hypothetical protein